MKYVLMTASAIALGSGGAHAAGIERSAQSVGIIFEEGNYAELSFGGFNPDVVGAGAGPYAGTSSGDMAPGYGTFSFGLKQSLSERLDFAVILDQPVGANVSYPVQLYPFAGGTADIDSLALTALLRYKFPSNISIIGGLRAQQVTGEVSIPSIGGYTMTTDTDRKVGYVVGIAWEKPEIAARVALTYNSEIEHDLTAQEKFAAMPAAVTTTFQTKIPQSVNLEFQTGVAPDTLLFGSIRWVEWSVFDISPPVFANAPCATPGGPVPCGPLAKLDSDYVAYTLGLGRKFSDQWSGAVIAGYEGASGDLQGNLGPTDGSKSLGLAATYTMDNVKITGGVRYVSIGDATTKGVGSRFTDNSGVGVGIRIGYSF